MNKQIFISSSSIQTFNECKRKFKLKYIDKVQVFQRTSNKYISFGESIHKTLAQYNSITDAQYQTLAVLHNLLRKNWIRDGYESLQEERQFGLNALDILTNYFNHKQDNGKRILTEEMIKMKLDNGFMLCGKIDTAYTRDDQSLEVSDYKTGKSISSADGTQLSIYVLLTMQRLGTYPNVVSNYYLAHNDKVEIPVTEEFIDNSIKLLDDMCTTIEGEIEFPYSPTPYCRSNCEYYEQCEGAKDVNAIVIRDLEGFLDNQVISHIF